MTNNALLECNNIYKKIGKKTIIENLSLTLSEGDILGFIGENGAGKTTTMKLILGLQTISKGTVKICGYNLNKNFKEAISNIGAIIETPDLYMYMTGYQNLKINCKIYNIKTERLNEVIKTVGLEKNINDKLSKYSLGMRQRLGIACAILHRPKILILDEPMNGLDPKGVIDLRNLLVTLAKKEKMAIMISSHLLNELETFCNRICIISKGKIIKDESIKEIEKLTNKASYIIELNNTKLESILSNYEVIDKNHIKISISQTKLNDTIKTLLLNEISIFEIKKEHLSLEEIFMKTTKEQNNA